jgi:DNA-binding response OmpR family regulator
VVDDDPDLVGLLHAILATDGHTVDVAVGGQVALEQLALRDYDLVICDLRMPSVDGVIVYRAVERQVPPRPAVLFVASSTEAVGYEVFLRTTRVPVLAKPFNVDEVRAAVRRRLGTP